VSQMDIWGVIFFGKMRAWVAAARVGGGDGLDFEGMGSADLEQGTVTTEPGSKGGHPGWS
jgi:hypothetical protein